MRLSLLIATCGISPLNVRRVEPKEKRAQRPMNTNYLAEESSEPSPGRPRGSFTRESLQEGNRVIELQYLMYMQLVTQLWLFWQRYQCGMPYARDLFWKSDHNTVSTPRIPAGFDRWVEDRLSWERRRPHLPGGRLTEPHATALPLPLPY